MLHTEVIDDESVKGVNDRSLRVASIFQSEPERQGGISQVCAAIDDAARTVGIISRESIEHPLLIGVNHAQPAGDLPRQVHRVPREVRRASIRCSVCIVSCSFLNC